MENPKDKIYQILKDVTAFPHHIDVAYEEIDSLLTAQKQHYKERVDELIAMLPDKITWPSNMETGMEEFDFKGIQQSLKSKALDIFGEGEENV